MTDTCPVCGDRLEATVRFYLGNVVLDEAAQLKSFDVDYQLGGHIELYCAQGHDDIEGVFPHPSGEKNRLAFPTKIDVPEIRGLKLE